MEEQQHLLSPPPQEHLLLAHNPGSRKKKFIIIGALAGAVIGAAVVGYLLVSHFQQKQTASKAIEEKPLPSITIYYNDGVSVLWKDDETHTNSNTEANEGIASHFAFAIKQELKAKYGDDYYQMGEWKITSTLDKNMQELAEKELKDNAALFTKNSVASGAFLVQDVTNGQILAWIGDLRDPITGKLGDIDYVVQPTETGTLTRPFVYASLLEKTTKYGAGSQVNDTQGPLKEFLCTNKALPRSGGNCAFNFDLKYAGPMSLRYALGGVRNIPAYKAVDEVTPKYVQDTIVALGASDGLNCYSDGQLQQKSECYSANILGDAGYMTPKDMLSAYATLANNGGRQTQSLTLKVLLNNKSKYQWQQPELKQAIREDAAYIIDDILSDPKASYLPTTYKPYFAIDTTKVSIAHGIDNNSSVGHAVMFTPKYAVGFWTQRKQGASATATTETYTMPVIYDYLKSIQKRPALRTKPANILDLPAYITKNHVSLGTVEPSPSVDIYPSWYKQ